VAILALAVLEVLLAMAVSQEILDLEKKVEDAIARIAAQPSGLSADDKAELVAIGVKVDSIAQVPSA
jgi:hypothetical protein